MDCSWSVWMGERKQWAMITSGNESKGSAANAALEPEYALESACCNLVALATLMHQNGGQMLMCDRG